MEKSCINCKYQKNKIDDSPCKVCSNGNGDVNAYMKWEPKDIKIKIKTYKTWEAIKMLTENNKLKFKLKDKDNTPILSNGTLFASQFGFIHANFPENAKMEFQGNVSIDARWTLIQKPVNFKEAIRSWADGKTVKCTHCGRTFIYVGLKHKVMVDEKGEPLSKADINYGTWYIEQPNE